MFYTFIWNFCPQLIEEGYVYSLVAPLYKITIGKDTYKYLRDDAELAEFQEKNKGKKKDIVVDKGGVSLKIKDEEEIFEIADSYMDAIIDGTVKQYWEKV